MVLTLASVMYHRKWKQGVKFARQHVKAASLYVPEISDSDASMSEDELAKSVENMAVQVNMLTDADNLREVTYKFSGSSHSGLVSIYSLILASSMLILQFNMVIRKSTKSCCLYFYRQ